MVGSRLRSHMSVQTQYDTRSIRERRTDQPAVWGATRCDGRVVYFVHVYRRFLEALLHGAIHGYKISILYYLKVEGGAFPTR